MHQLRPDKYVPVFLKFETLKPWILPQSSIQRLKANAAFVKDAYQSQSLRERDKNIFYIKSLYESNQPSFLDDNYLYYLGFISLGIQAPAFLDWDETLKWKEKADLCLMSERFLYPFSSNIGSGRHVLLKDIHLKGIGRNVLCIQEEFSHSWGGMLVKDALKAYIVDSYVQKISCLGSLKILGAFIYDKLETRGVPYCVLMREADSFRLAQLNPMFLRQEEKNTVKDFLLKRFRTKTPNEMIDTIVENYLQSYSHGVKYKSITPDNLLIDGRWIDTESIDLNFDGTRHDEWISIKVASESSENNFNKDMRLSELDGKSYDFKFCDSWIHQLHLICKMTYNAYKDLWPELDYRFDEEFANKMVKHFPDSDMAPWMKILFDYESEIQEGFGFPLSRDNRWRHSDIPNLNLKLRGYFFNSLLNFKKLTFGENSGDSYDKMQAVVNKWEKIFWPIDLNFESASELAKTIEKMSAEK